MSDNTPEPYATYRSETGSAECEYCDDGSDIEGAHTHASFVSREGAASRTADELMSVFLHDVAALTSYVVPTDIPDPDGGWCDDPDASQALYDEATGPAEGALYDAGYTVTWDDGYVIERVTEDENA